jgi:hypothetical protein
LPEPITVVCEFKHSESRCEGILVSRAVDLLRITVVRRKRLAANTPLQAINCDDNVGTLKYLNEPIEEALVVVGSRLEIFLEDALHRAHGLKG